MKRRGPVGLLLCTGLLAAAVLCAPAAGHAHPMGNFSISHYAAIRVLATSIEVRYVLDLAEIPTFQEIQDSGIVAEAGHASVGPYLARKAETLGSGLVLELNGRRLTLERGAREILFTPGAGDLPTMKLGIVYRAALDARALQPQNHLVYRDGNYPERAGWKEVIADTGPRVAVLEASVPERDRSRALADYPTDLLNSPPQDLAAAITFTVAPLPPIRAAAGPFAPPPGNRERQALESVPLPPPAAPASPAVAPASLAVAPVETPPSSERPLRLEPNSRATPRDAFTALIATPEISASILVFAALLAAALGAFHALEPGHGKTVVAAYLVGSRGTARHALILGLIVTASHTAGVYLLGGVTLYASRYIVPERLYPWLGAVSGLIIAALGFALFLRRYAGRDEHHGHAHHGHDHAHDHAPGHHHHGHPHGHEHVHDHGHDHGDHHHLPAGQTVSLRQLFALGITGGIVPCPAALVVLLSAVALRRVGFGLFLIAAFSVGLAAVLIAIGLLMVYARRLMARFQGEGRVVTRWLPLTSSAVMTVLGLAIAGQALMAAGIL